MQFSLNSAIQKDNNTPDLNHCPYLPFILAEPQAQLDEGSNYQVHIPEVPKYLLEPDDYPRTLSELDKFQMAKSKIDELTATNSLFKLVIVASTKTIHIGGKFMNTDNHLPAAQEDNIKEDETLSHTTEPIVDSPPFEVSLPEGYELIDNSVYRDGNRICDCISKTGYIHFPEENYYDVSIKVENSITGELFEITTPKSNLIPYTPGAHSLIAELTDKGADIEPRQGMNTLEFLARQKPKMLTTGVRRTGHYKDKKTGLNSFVFPNKTIGDQNILYRPHTASPKQKAMHSKGSIEDWKENIASKCVLNPISLFIMGTGLSAPLLHPLQQPGGGFHICGSSSIGKTAVAQVAASIWGNGDDPANSAEPVYIQSYNSTNNAMESTAAAYNDLSLVMDELGSSTDKNIGSTLYNLANGTGKDRANKTGGETPTRNSRVLVISTGEQTISEQIRAVSGKSALAGQRMRLVDLPIEEQSFLNTGEQTAGDFVTDLKESSAKDYGTAGPFFVKSLIDRMNDPEQFQLIVDEFKSTTKMLEKKCTEPAQKRAVKRFAMVYVALYIAIEIKLIDCTLEKALESVEYALDIWLDNFPVISDIDKAIANIRTFILRYPNRFRDAHKEPVHANNILGYINTNGDKYYLIPREHFVEVSAHGNVKAIVKKINAMGFLHRNNGAHLTSVLHVAGIGRISGYAISARLLNHGVPDISGELSAATHQNNSHILIPATTS